VSAHDYCTQQNYPLLIKDAPAQCKRWRLNADLDPNLFKSRYLNAVHHVDGILKEVVDTLKKAKLDDQTIVVITSDHGESFNDHHNNHWGHSNSFSATELHVPMIIHWPGKAPQQIQYFTSHYDLAPTFLKDLRLFSRDLKPYIMGDSLFISQKNSKQLMMVGSYFFMGALKKDKYYVFSPDGRVKTYDMDEKLLSSDRMSPKDLAYSMQIMSQFFNRKK
jgi:membrane-anchored protein YejM (alkaline phosphatase superfamily)